MVTTVRMPAPALESAVWAALHDVHDPEIPTISVVDLGIVNRVVTTPGAIHVELLPTFVGCPALDVMRHDVEQRLRPLADAVSVEFVFTRPWTSERITPEGRQALRRAGYAPPSESVECPFCGSRNTTLENVFGPALCRAIYHCADCRQPFEQFKAI
jgi:ring-1,2-phenylacetyl-CoA epoxidase subunit PaaD